MKKCVIPILNGSGECTLSSAGKEVLTKAVIHFDPNLYHELFSASRLPNYFYWGCSNFRDNSGGVIVRVGN